MQAKFGTYSLGLSFFLLVRSFIYPLPAQFEHPA
jgi:hypothetical protein